MLRAHRIWLTDATEAIETKIKTPRVKYGHSEAADLPNPALPGGQITPENGLRLDTKIFCFCSHANQFITPAIPPGKRGGSRSSRTRGGMRWTQKLRLTSVADADGEVVWSCSPLIFSFAKERIKLIKTKYFGNMGRPRKRPALSGRAPIGPRFMWCIRKGAPQPSANAHLLSRHSLFVIRSMAECRPARSAVRHQHPQR
jgi:hypothetical protein